jgi:hypothetical protein
LRGKAVIPAAACNYLLGEFQRAICVDAQDEAVATELMSRGLARRDASGLAGRRRNKYDEEDEVSVTARRGYHGGQPLKE